MGKKLTKTKKTASVRSQNETNAEKGPGNNNRSDFVDNPFWYESFSNKIISGIEEQKNKFDSCLNWLLTLNTAIFGGIIAIIGAGFGAGKDNWPRHLGYEMITYLCFVGLLWSWMIMLRSTVAYRQLTNFDTILYYLHKYLQDASKTNWELFMHNKKQLDYSLSKSPHEGLCRVLVFQNCKAGWNKIFRRKDTKPGDPSAKNKREGSNRVFVLKRCKALWKNVNQEYSAVYIIYGVIIVFSFYKQCNLFTGDTDPSENWFAALISSKTNHGSFFRTIGIFIFLLVLLLWTYFRIFYKKEDEYIPKPQEES